MKSLTLIISSEFPPGPGGIGQHAYSLVKALVANNFDIAAISVVDVHFDLRCESIAQILHFPVTDFFFLICTKEKVSLKNLLKYFIIPHNKLWLQQSQFILGSDGSEDSSSDDSSSDDSSSNDAI